MTMPEQDLRMGILNSLLTTPHRELSAIWPLHSELVRKDPRFYVRLAAWYADHGEVRDHKEMFIVSLVLSEFEGHRDVGLALLRELPPYEVIRVVDFISGRKTQRPARPDEEEQAVRDAAPSLRQRFVRRWFGSETPEPAGAGGERLMITEQQGLGVNIPRAMRTEITRYLREREADPAWFDSTVLTARKAVKRLYALLHVRPNERAQQILFDDRPPADSRLHALRQLTVASSPADQARAIVENRIPYRVAATVVQQMTPTVMLALVQQMSPQEVINNLSSLKRRGALDIPEIMELVEAKLEAARTDDRVSALKASKAIEVAGVTADVRKQLEGVADAQIKAKGRIERPVALLIDKSGSMEVAIELGKQMGAMISAICDRELYAYAFDTMAYEIVAQGNEVADWGRALAGIKAGGATSCGVAFTYLIRKQQYVEQIVLITDEEENNAPRFVDGLQQYSRALNVTPAVCIVRTPGGSSQIEQQCLAAGIDASAFQFNGDYYSLPNLIPMLARPSRRLELLMEIMDYPLPARKTA